MIIPCSTVILSLIFSDEGFLFYNLSNILLQNLTANVDDENADNDDDEANGENGDYDE